MVHIAEMLTVVAVLVAKAVSDWVEYVVVQRVRKVLPRRGGFSCTGELSEARALSRW